MTLLRLFSSDSCCSLVCLLVISGCASTVCVSAVADGFGAEMASGTTPVGAVEMGVHG